VTYLYDAGNRRVRKDFPAGSSYADADYYYVGWQVVEETDAGSTTPNRQYVDGNYIDEHLVMDVNEDAEILDSRRGGTAGPGSGT